MQTMRGYKQQSGWGKADLHLHTTYSDGIMTPEETVDLIAKSKVVDVIAITDHDTAEGAFVAQEHARKHHPQLDVIIGQEVSTGDGDVLGIFIQNTLPVYKTAVEAIEAIHDQGGLAIAAHPFVFGWGLHSVGNAIRTLPFDAVETRHGCPINIPGNIRAGWVNQRAQQLPSVGSSDSHIPHTTGQAFSWFPGSIGADLRRAIEENTIRPGGTTWKISSLLRTLPVLFERGWTAYPGTPELKQY